MIQVYMTDAGEERVRAVRAFRLAADALGYDPGIKVSILAVDAVRGGAEALIGQTEDLDVASEAVRILGEHGCDGEAREAEATPEESFAEASNRAMNEGAESEEEESPASYEACQVAAVLLAVAKGNPTEALSISRTLERVTDPELYGEIERFLLDTFPEPDESFKRQLPQGVRFMLPPGMQIG